METRPLTCAEALRRVGRRRVPCCKRCHHHDRTFVFKLDDRYAQVCCEVAQAIQRSGRHSKGRKVEVSFSPAEVMSMTG